MFDDFFEPPPSPLVVVAQRGVEKGSASHRRPRGIRVLVLAAKGMILCLGTYGAWRLVHSDPTLKVESRPASKAEVIVHEPNRPKLPTPDEIDARNAASLAEQDRMAVSRAKLSEAYRSVEETNSACDRLDSAINAWSANVLVLLDDDSGRYIAARKEFLPILGPLFETSVPTIQEAASARASVASLTHSILEAWEGKNYLYIASPELVDSLASIANRSKAQSIEIETMTRKVLDLLAVSQARGEKSTLTLRQAITHHRQVTADEAARAEAEAKERERLSGIRYRVQQAATFERDQQSIQNRQQQAEHQAALILAHAKLNAAQSEQDRQRRIAYANSPEIQTLLLPFITPGFEQLDGTYTAEPRPYSWQKLQSSGALVDGRGFDIMLQLVSSPNDKDRPRWFANGTYDGAHHHRDQIREAQRLLRELGPTLVQIGMLDP